MTTRHEEELVTEIEALGREERMVIELLIVAMTTGPEPGRALVTQELDALTDRTDLDRGQRFQEAWGIVMRDVDRREAAGSQTA